MHRDVEVSVLEVQAHRVQRHSKVRILVDHLGKGTHIVKLCDAHTLLHSYGDGSGVSTWGSYVVVNSDVGFAVEAKCSDLVHGRVLASSIG